MQSPIQDIVLFAIFALLWVIGFPAIKVWLST